MCDCGKVFFDRNPYAVQMLYSIVITVLSLFPSTVWLIHYYFVVDSHLADLLVGWEFDSTDHFIVFH